MTNKNNTVTISAEASSKKINSAIDKVAKAGHDVNDTVQDVILMVLEHAVGVGQGDVTGMARLINRLPDNFDKLGIVKFCQKCSPIRFNKVKVGENSTYSCSLIKEGEQRRDGTSLYVPWNLDWARAHKWYTINADRMKRQLDFYTANSAVDLIDRNIASLERMLNQQLELGKEEVEKDGKKETVIRYTDRVPDDEKGYVRAIIQALKTTKSDFKSGKLAPINDVGKMEHPGEKAQSQTPDQPNPEDALRTGTNN